LNKEIAKQKLKAGEIQIHFDNLNHIDLLNELSPSNEWSGTSYYYTIDNALISPLDNLCVIKISDITEDSSEMEQTEMETIFLISDLQHRKRGDIEWLNYRSDDFEYRLKPKPDYNKEIEALQLKAAENGMKAVVTFENL